jgi:hypothetical protein
MTEQIPKSRATGCGRATPLHQVLGGLAAPEFRLGVLIYQ